MTTLDPAIEAYRAWRHACWSSFTSLGAAAWKAAGRAQDIAETEFLSAVPTSFRGAVCHIQRACRLRLSNESSAALDVPADHGGALLRALKLLWRGDPSGLGVLRAARDAIADTPLEDSQDDETLDHLELALGFLTKPRPVESGPNKPGCFRSAA